MNLSCKLNKRRVSSFSAAFTVFSIILLLSLGATPGWSQAASGTITGQVMDQQSAAIPGADVKLVDVTTNSVQSTTTNDVGRYTFVSVPPGVYNVSVSHTGFTQAKIQGQKVDVGSALTLNVTLELGATSTIVEVKAAAGAELQTLNATIGTTITNEQLNLLPNLGRDASTLSVLQVGVSLAGNVAGAATDQNGFGLDGGNNSDDMAGTNTTYTPGNGYSGGGATGGTPTGVIPTPVESIEEFKIGTSNQTAEFNNAAGSQVQMVTKRGTNAFHGSLYEYYFGSNVGAANLWKNNHVPSAGLPYTPLPATHRNRFGASVGGPMTPKILGGKTYFFYNYEGSRFPNVTSFERGSPTALMRAGVLILPNSAGVNTPYNLNPFPVTVNGTTYQPAQCGGGPCDPRGLGVNPLVQKIWNTMPLPNDPGFTNGSGTTGLVDGINAQGYLGNLALPQTSNFMVGRIDHDFGEKWKFMTSYRYYKFKQFVNTQTDVGGLLSGAKQGAYTSFAPRPVQPSYWVAGLTTMITPNTSNDFRFSYLRNFWQWSTQAGPAQFGLGGALELGGENLAGSLIPYNVDSQDVRQRFWDGHDYFLSDTVSMLKGNHLLQFGGSYMRQFLFHGRDDNGVGINTSIVYQAGGTGISNGSYTLPNGTSASALTNYPIMFNELMGLVTQTQVMYSRLGANLQLNPLGTPGFDQSVVPTYDVHFTDTWHIKPSLTLTYGLGYGLAMPPYEINGKQVSMVDAAGNFIDIKGYMNARQAAALKGQVYEPQIGFATIKNVSGDHKYPYDPFYGGFSPRASLAWSPGFDNGILGAIFGRNKTVIRGGFARIYGRLNGVDLMLVPLLGPGLLQAVSCVAPLTNGTCAGAGGATLSNAFRAGVDGNVAPLPAVTATLPQPFFPGSVQNGILNTPSADGSQLDPKMRPNHSNEFTFSIQRSLGSKMMFEAGYIGRQIKNEFQEINLDAVPWMTTLNGQSFAQAWANVYGQICPGSGPLCSTAAAAAAGAVTPQAFFEAAMGGANSPYCTGFASCTAAVASKEVANIRTTRAYTAWLDLANANGWTLGRTLLAQQPATGRALSGAFDFINSYGFGNYNAAFFSFTARDFHGLTARSNFTWGRALGTGSVVQASSSISVPNPYDFKGGFGTYGVQPFDVKFTYSLLMFYQSPFFKAQKGVIGRILGGWTIAPLFTARTGQPQRLSTSTNGESFGEIYSGQTANYEGAAGFTPFNGGNSAQYNVQASSTCATPGGNASVGTSGNTGMNMFANPCAVYNEFRRPVLGLDTGSGGFGIRGFPYWNVDATISKDFRVTERMGATLTFQFVNLFNHFTPADPATSIDTPTSFGVVNAQYASPNGSQNRSLEFGLRIRF